MPAADALITPAPGMGTVTVTTAQAEATVFLIPGQHLLVVAGDPRSGSTGAPTPGQPAFWWTVPIAASPGPLQPRGTRVCPDGSAIAAFLATSTGATTVSTRTDAACLHARPACAIDQEEVEFYVVVRRPPLAG